MDGCDDTVYISRTLVTTTCREKTSGSNKNNVGEEKEDSA